MHVKTITNTDARTQPVGLGWHPYFPKRARSRLYIELAERWDPLVGDRQTELVFIGIDMDEADLRARLDPCVLTAAEVEAGMEAWATYPDPLPAWDLLCDLDDDEG